VRIAGQRERSASINVLNLMMQTTVLQAILKANAVPITIALATLFNVLLLAANMAYSRRLRRRSQALRRAEQRLGAGPVTASLQERFSNG
jgi:predicted lysophospholipase L1 biosynthesis ABC-type transport system permease subunit